MATKKKLLQAAAGNAGGAALDVDDVFSTYLYEGNATARDITNNIDLSGEGGLVWIKNRESGSYNNHNLYDTENGSNQFLRTNGTNALTTASGFGLTAFNSDGFSMGSAYGNESGIDTVSWSFRKAENFFDAVTYTGDGTVGRNISHNLGSKPGCVIVKKTSGSEGWFVSHRGYNSGANTGYLNMTNAFTAGTSTEIPVYYATDTTFRVSNISGQSYANTNGATYVAYIFAHNDGDGEFGPDADQDIIKCGGFNTIIGDVDVDLGFEPQFILFKSATTGDNWNIVDTMRGWANARYSTNKLSANTSGAEEGSVDFVTLTSTGFKAVFSEDGLASNHTYIYVAIRRPTAVPETATEVFAIDSASGTAPTPPLFTAGFPVDMYLFKTADTNSDWKAFDRIRGDQALLNPNTTDAESDTGDDTGQHQDLMTGIGTATYTNADQYQWMWKRAPKYMDVVAFTGTGSAGTHNHNLTVPAEMMWVKSRAGNGNWFVYHSGLGATKYLFLNETSAAGTASSVWNDTAPTSSVFSVGASVNQASASIAYLFATLAGISKVGSVTHSGTTNVDCGFSSGARFVLLKRTDASGDWYVWDSERGIVSGNDPYLLLNTTAAQVTNTDYIDPLSSGFTITSSFTGGDYIFYAIA